MEVSAEWSATGVEYRGRVIPEGSIPYISANVNEYASSSPSGYSLHTYCLISSLVVEDTLIMYLKVSPILTSGT